MSKRLFCAEVTAFFYVVAESEAEAQKAAERVLRCEHDVYDSADVFVSRVNARDLVSSIEAEWRDALPYGGDGSKTVREYFAETPYDDPNQLVIDGVKR